MADFPAQPASLNVYGGTAFGTSTGINTTGVQVLAANPNRKWGVWLKCTHATNGALVGKDSGSAVVAAVNNVTAPRLFIPGTGAIFVKAAASTTDVDWIEY